MPDSKITALTNLTAADAINDMFPIVDVSDNLITASGTTKRISVNNLLSSSPTASGAFTVTGLVTAGSATITGDLTVDTNVLKVDTTLNRVGIGTATPGAGYVLDVVGAARITAANGLVIDKAGAGFVDFLNSGNSGANVGTSGTGGLVIYTANGIGGAYGVRYVIDSTGISTWSVGGSEAMRLNSTGLGIGVVPSTHDAGKGLEVGALGNGLWCNNSTFNQLLQNATYNGGWKYAAAASTAASRLEMGGSFGFYIAPAGTAPNAITFGDAKMTLDASGRLYINTTSQNYGAAFTVVQYTGTSVYGVSYKNSVSGNGTAAVFVNSSNALAGYIDTTNTTVTYNSVSDYRLKELVVPLSGGLARVNALKPSTYKWKVDGSSGEGFIAHELAEVVPAAVSGEKDAVNADGSIKPQGVDLSKVVPILVAAIQELTAEVNALKNA